MEALLKYDDEQPRDEGGKWTAGGGDFAARAKGYMEGEYSKAAEKEERVAYKELEKSNPKFSRDEKQALAEYSEMGYDPINKALREGASADTEDCKMLDAILSRSSLSSDTELLRGAVLSPEVLEQFKPGVVVTDKGYVSTTTNSYMLRFFTSKDSFPTPGMSSVVFSIQADKGSKALPIDKYSDSKGEREILLPRDSQFEVVSVTKFDATSTDYGGSFSGAYTAITMKYRGQK